MRATRGVLLLLFLVIAGCQAPVTVMRPGAPAVTIPLPPEPGAVARTVIEPAYESLPAATFDIDDKPFSGTYRGLDEKLVQCRAAAKSALATLLESENEKSSVLGVVKRKGVLNPAGDDLLREARRLAALDLRNKAALDALERYYQLADAEGRRSLFADGLAAFDQLRAESPKFRDVGLPTPSDDEFMRQRLKLLADREAIDAGIDLLQQDLIAKLDLKMNANERLWPMGPFTVSVDTIDTDAAVRTALAQRADLQLLRTLQERLSSETLPSMREAMQTLHGLAGQAMPASPIAWWTRFRSSCTPGPSPFDAEELEARKKQIAELLASREAEATAAVKASLSQMSATVKRIAVLRARAESFGEKVAKAKAENKTADILTLEGDFLKARADVLTAVMEWHQWRVRLKAAQGLLVQECLASPSTPLPQNGPQRVKVMRSPLRK